MNTSIKKNISLKKSKSVVKSVVKSSVKKSSSNKTLVKSIGGSDFIKETTHLGILTKLLPHQLKPVKYLVSLCEQQHGLLLMHIQGSGKTKIGLFLAKNYPTKSVVIICPKGIDAVWAKEAKLLDVKISLFINYDNLTPKLLKKHSAIIKDSILIMDEAHHIIEIIDNISEQEEIDKTNDTEMITEKKKNSKNKEDENKSKNSLKYMLNVFKSSKKVLLLSGTPIRSDVGDFRWLVNIAAGKRVFPYNIQEFKKEYYYVNKFSSFVKKWLGPIMKYRNPLTNQYIIGEENYFDVFNIPKQEDVIRKKILWARNKAGLRLTEDTNEHDYINKIKSLEKKGYTQNQFNEISKEIERYENIQERDKEQEKEYKGFKKQEEEIRKLIILKDTLKEKQQKEPNVNFSTFGEITGVSRFLGYLIPSVLNPNSSFIKGIFKYFENETIKEPVTPLNLNVKNDGYGFANWLAFNLVAKFSFGVLLKLSGNYIDDYDYEALNLDKIRPASPYVSYYKYDNLDYYPSSKIIIKRIPYTNYQLSLFTRAFPNVVITDKESVNLEFNKNIEDAELFKPQRLTTELYFNKMRKLGNLTGENPVTGKIDYPTKFIEIAKIYKEKPRQTVVYSNFKNSLFDLRWYLETKGIKSVYLGPEMSIDKQTKIKEDFMKEKINFLLIDPVYYEGLSLNGVRVFHILEPVLEYFQREQLYARPIRYLSHAHLDKSKRNVILYQWACTLDNVFEKIRKEKNEFSNWFNGNFESVYLPQIKILEKDYSPDDSVFNKIEKIARKMDDFAKKMKTISIDDNTALHLLHDTSIHPKSIKKC
jgi:hypothetical protein